MIQPTANFENKKAESRFDYLSAFKKINSDYFPAA